MVGGCGNSDKANVQAVMDAMNAANPPDNNSIAGLAANLQAIDTSRCPGDFREAFQRFCDSLAEHGDYRATEPQSFEEGVATGFLNALGGEADGGMTRMVRTRAAYEARAQAAFSEVKTKAVKYG